MNIILASSSPRRLELLRNVGIEVQVRVPDVDETPLENENAYEMVSRLAKLKADAIILPKALKDSVIIAADTIVNCDNQILGKPVDKNDALGMLNLLSGKTHQVMTGFVVKNAKKSQTGVCITDITFRTLSRTEIHFYVNMRESFDKAGAYGIQGAGACLIKSITGSYTNVMGLPVEEILMALKYYDK